MALELGYAKGRLNQVFTRRAVIAIRRAKNHCRRFSCSDCVPDVTISAMNYWQTFLELIRTPFLHATLIWGIVPLYFGLLLSELTSSKANFRTAIQTGFSFLWAGAQWLAPYFKVRQPTQPQLDLSAMLPVYMAVTFLVIALGVIALISGLRKRFFKNMSFVGHTRFANYFMIMIFPIQAHYLKWTWAYFITVVLFAVPVWLVLHFGLMPIRSRR
jgi:hypothetical protein